MSARPLSQRRSPSTHKWSNDLSDFIDNPIRLDTTNLQNKMDKNERQVKKLCARSDSARAQLSPFHQTNYEACKRALFTQQRKRSTFIRKTNEEIAKQEEKKRKQSRKVIESLSKPKPIDVKDDYVLEQIICQRNSEYQHVSDRYPGVYVNDLSDLRKLPKDRHFLRGSKRIYYWGV